MTTEQPKKLIPIGQIIQGDNVEVLKTFPDNCIDLTVTSPPYDNLRTYKGYSFNFEGVAKELYRVTKEGGVVVWVVQNQVSEFDESDTSEKQAQRFKEIGFKKRTMIYAKDGRYTRNDWYRRSWEFMFVFTKGTPKTTNFLKDQKNISFFENKVRRRIAGNRQEDGTIKHRVVNSNPYGVRDDIWFYHTGYMSTSSDKIAYEHPAIFPDALAEDHIKSWSNEGDIILDPFAGSGTTLKAAEKLMRKWVGIEIAPEYCKIAEKRLEPYRNQTRLS